MAVSALRALTIKPEMCCTGSPVQVKLDRGLRVRCETVTRAHERQLLPYFMLVLRGKPG